MKLKNMKQNIPVQIIPIALNFLQFKKNAKDGNNLYFKALSICNTFGTLHAIG